MASKSTKICTSPMTPVKPVAKRDRNQTSSQKKKTKCDKKPEDDGDAIERLLRLIPQVDQHFKVHKKVGEGTFSNVFVATNKSLSVKKKFAIKHIMPTSHPTRMLQELQCLRDIGGQSNVVGLELCFRMRDSVAFVMPYLSHDSFSDYVQDMTIEETKLYMKNLLLALERVHSYQIIHRDVKPSNFLFNRKERRFLLVDFGLSHHVDDCKKNDESFIGVSKKRKLDTLEKESNWNEAKRRPVLHSLSTNIKDKADSPKGAINKSANKNNSQKKPSPEMYKENSPISNQQNIMRDIRRVKRNLQFGNLTNECAKFTSSTQVFQPLIQESNNFLSLNKIGSSFVRLQHSQVKSQYSISGSSQKRVFRLPGGPRNVNENCGCDKKARICNTCLVRRPIQALRAGTAGYRPPEVLMKYPLQTTAVDIWAAGVILLSILSRSYPFFRAPDDIIALMELIAIFGMDVMKTLASKLGRNLITNDNNRRPLDLYKLCQRLRNRKKNPLCVDLTTEKCDWCMQPILKDEGCLCIDSSFRGISSCDGESSCNRKDGVYDLLKKLLTVDPSERITAKDALQHPFLK